MLKPRSVKKKPRNGKRNNKEPKSKACQCPEHTTGLPQEKKLLDEPKMPELPALFRPESERAPVIERGTVSAVPGPEVGPDPRVPDAEAGLRDLRVLSTSIATYLVRAVVEAVVVKAQSRETEVVAETEIGIGTRIETLAGLVTKKSLGDAADREVVVAGETGIGRGQGREVVARM